MVQTLFNHNAVDEVSSTRDTYVKAYRVMLLARILDEKFASLYRMGKIHGGVFLGRGQEALSASVGLALETSSARSSATERGGWRLGSQFWMGSGPIWDHRWGRCAGVTETFIADGLRKGC